MQTTVNRVLYRFQGRDFLLYTRGVEYGQQYPSGHIKKWRLSQPLDIIVSFIGYYYSFWLCLRSIPVLNVSLADETTGVINRFAQCQFEDLRLQTTLRGFLQFLQASCATRPTLQCAPITAGWRYRHTPAPPTLAPLTPYFT